MSALAAALELADEGRPVFPCSPDKRPLIRGGHTAATLDPALIRTWWRENPDALVGVPTGAASGLDVLDIDPRNGGEAWERENAPVLRGARCVQTRSGGRHYYYEHSPGLRCSAGSVAPGVDVRSDGGYVIWWPAHGLPVINDAPAAPWPAPLLAQVRAGRPAAPAGNRSPADIAPPSCEAVVALLNNLPNPADTTRDEWVSVMLAAVGCIRALEAAGEDCDAEAVREAACGWAERWPLHDGTDERAKWDDDFATREPSNGWSTLLRFAQRVAPELAASARQGQAAAEFASVPAPPPATDAAEPEQQTARRKVTLLSLAALERMPDPTWLIDGLIPERGLVVPYGPPKQGKTFIVLSAALHIAAGRPWCGRDVQQGGVVYIAGEGAGGLKARIGAAREHFGLPSDLPFWLIGRAVNFGDQRAVAELAAAIRETAGAVPVRLVVVDTLARAMPGLDESKVQDMSAVIAACDGLKEALGCTVMPVHHSGKDEGRGARGSSALAGAVDAAFVITRSATATSDVVEMRNEFQKDGAEAPPLHFDLMKVGGSLVPVLRQGAAVKLRELPRGEAKALAVLASLAGDGEGVPVAEWRQACVADLSISAAERPADRERAFRRALQGLADRHAVLLRGELARPAGSGWSEFGPVQPGEIVTCASASDSGQTPDMSGLSAVRQGRGERTDRTSPFRGVRVRPLPTTGASDSTGAKATGAKASGAKATGASEPLPEPTEEQLAELGCRLAEGAGCRRDPRSAGWIGFALAPVLGLDATDDRPRLVTLLGGMIAEGRLVAERRRDAQRKLREVVALPEPGPEEALATAYAAALAPLAATGVPA